MVQSINLAVGYAAVYVKQKPTFPKEVGLDWKPLSAGLVLPIQSRRPNAMVAAVGGMSCTNQSSSKYEKPKLNIGLLPFGIEVRPT